MDLLRGSPRLLAVIVFATSAGFAQASLAFSLDQTDETAQPGETLTFEGSLTNTGEHRVNFTGFGWNAPSGFASDLYSTVPIYALGPGASYHGPLFELKIADDADFGEQVVRIDAGSYDVVTHDESYTYQTVRVNVVPEPVTLFGLVLPLAGYLRRGRPKPSRAVRSRLDQP